jgi:hypothetical protein
MKKNLFVLFNVLSVLNLCFSEDLYENGLWRRVLDEKESCWTQRACSRVMTTSHGGDWNLTFPYDSMPAFMKAFDNGADAIKGDFRVAKDNVGYLFIYL